MIALGMARQPNAIASQMESSCRAELKEHWVRLDSHIQTLLGLADKTIGFDSLARPIQVWPRSQTQYPWVQWVRQLGLATQSDPFALGLAVEPDLISLSLVVKLDPNTIGFGCRVGPQGALGLGEMTDPKSLGPARHLDPNAIGSCRGARPNILRSGC